MNRLKNMYKNYKKIRDKKFLKMRWEVYTIYRIAREMSYYTIYSREGGGRMSAEKLSNYHLNYIIIA